MSDGDPAEVPQLVFETAGEHATDRIPMAAPDARAEEIRRSLAGRRFDSAAEIAVCEGGRLLGLLAIEDLFAAPPHALARDLMDSDPPVAAPGLDQEKAAWKAVRHGEGSLAIVDERGAFVGLIPRQRLLRVLLAEHDEDIARLGGFLRGASEARGAVEEPLRQRLWHRLPWLLVGLAGALASADLVGLYEEVLARDVILAFFLPGIVYLADAVGTQTETLLIRGLSVGVPIASVVRREMATGLVIGAVLAVPVFGFAALRFGREDVAVAAALALLAACATATLVALALPWLLHRLGRDPAFGSGPVATVIQDLLSIFAYLAIATAMVG